MDYHRHILDMERKNHHLLLSKVATVVRAQIDIYERISNKGLADPMLEQVSSSRIYIGTLPGQDSNRRLALYPDDASKS